MSQTFTRILVAKYSPKNNCHVKEGDTLAVTSRKTVPQSESVEHFFVSATDLKTRASYGWVKEVEPFTLDEFLARSELNERIAVEDRPQIKAMLCAIDKLPPGTPVAATYSRRGIEKKRMELIFHKVFFYKKPK